MNVSRRVRDQLVLSKQLLTQPGDPYPASPDPLLLVHDLIVCCGAAELALAAIFIQLGCVPDKKEIFLPDYLDSLGKTSHPAPAVEEIDYIAELHTVRSNLHLRSILPDSRRWIRAKQETLEHVANWCRQFLGLPLADLDSVQSTSATLPAFSAEQSASNETLSLLALRDPDRRRYECFGSALIRLALARRPEKGRIANLSAGGCYVVTDFPFEVGEQVEMYLYVNTTSFRVTGSVIHIPSLVAAGNRKAGVSGMGIQFVNMSAGACIRLKDLIEELKTVPALAIRQALN